MDVKTTKKSNEKKHHKKTGVENKKGFKKDYKKPFSKNKKKNKPYVHWTKEDDFVTNLKYKNEYFPQEMTIRLLQLEQATNTNHRKIGLEVKQVRYLAPNLFVSHIKDGKQTTIFMNGDLVNVVHSDVKSADEFKGIVNSQGINREFSDKDKLELWLLRRYQTSTFNDNLKKFEEQRGWLTKMINLLTEIK